jgi:tetratricopeptide (TPR) repeat protein
MHTDELFRVGLAWYGSSGNKDNENRSCPLAAFEPLFDLKGVVFYSLQIGDGSDQLDNLPDSMKVVDLTGCIHDYADSAALIENLDLVISVCTSVAHLAGAINRPVWTLLHFASDWRWLLERNDSPWYPSMRLFRQTAPGDWAGVIARVKDELAQMFETPGFHNQRGVTLMLKGDLAGAELAFSHAVALDQMSAEAYCNRGAALHALDRLDEALICYQTALVRQPDFQQALFNMGNTYISLNRPEDAQVCYEREIELNPNFVAAHLCLGEVGKRLQNFTLARTAFEQAATLDPNSAEAFQGVAEIMQAEEHFEDAIANYRRALELKPESTFALNMMGTAYQSIERLDEAEKCYRQALDFMPDQPSVFNNLAVVLNAEGRLEEAVEVYRHLLDLDPDYADGHWNLAVALLAKGAYSEGWREFEWRFRKVNPVPLRLFSQPLWDGSRLSGKTILLHAEQGFGDTIQFARYAPLVAQRGGKVIIECQTPALREVLHSLEGVSQVVVAGETLPYFDFHLPLMSLPLVFDTTLESIPCKIPYLAADPQKAETWRRRVGESSRFKVGLVWYAKQSQVLNRKRSCPLRLFSPLWNVEGVEFYTLQIGVGTEQLEYFSASHQIIDLTRDITSFADTAAFISNLDLVISIDTAVAHLAGALGAKTWVILPFVAEWRWLCQREDSPWYPTLRLFRQPSQGDWLSLMNDVAAVLDDSVRDRDGYRNVPSNPARLRVGLAWAGRQSHPLNWRRSCPFSALAPLFNLPYISFVKLQPDQFDDDAPSDTRLIDLTEHIHDFEDTAALMANLDLIISIDTAAAHLAAATGRPTWLLLSHAAEWRWLTDRVDSPWYPAMRLFRQRDHGDWEGLIQEVAHRLTDLSNGQLNWNEQVLPECSCSGHSPERQMLERQLEDHLNGVLQNGNSPDAHLNLGASLALCGRYSEAAASFRRVLELDPEHVAGHLNLAYSLLASGDYPEGWRHFEWRLRYIDADLIPPWPMLQPDELLFHQNGTSLLVHCEQGYGDTIQFSRFLTLLAESGYRVIVSCQPPVASLVQSIPGVSRVIPHGDLLPLCDRQILLLSLPWLFSVSRELLPLSIPYLLPGEQKVKSWREKLEIYCAI